jgi:transcriptional regulator with XRE-family HTH domain
VTEFPYRLRELRENRRVSRRVLAELCGLSKNMVSRYERGERVPSIDEAAVLADYFGVTLDDLCGRKKPRE